MLRCPLSTVRRAKARWGRYEVQYEMRAPRQARRGAVRADINNLRAAVRELQDAVVKLAEEVDRDREEQ